MPGSRLTTVIESLDPFRSKDESRPILTSTFVRKVKGERRGTELLEFWATDSYRAVRIGVPIDDDIEVEDPDNQLVDGVMFTLPATELRRLNAAVSGRRRKLRFLHHTYTMTMSSRDEDAGFGLTRSGAWNGRGCYVSVDDTDAPVVAAGRRHRGTYPNIVSLFTAVGEEVELTSPLGMNPAFLGDVMRCATRFIGGDLGAAIKLDGVQGVLKPFRFRVHQQREDGLTFEALMMPVRIG